MSAALATTNVGADLSRGAPGTRRHWAKGHHYDPWLDLQRRIDAGDLRLKWAELTPARGLLVPDRDGPGRTVWLHYSLGGQWSRATLTHELVHDERARFYTANTPTDLVQAEEKTVRRLTAIRLVPPDQLRKQLLAGLPNGAPIEDIDYGWLRVRFMVPDAVMRDALEVVSEGRGAAARLAGSLVRLWEETRSKAFVPAYSDSHGPLGRWWEPVDPEPPIC